MLNHAIYKSCLFLCAGAVEKKTGSTDLDKLGGLAKAMPITFGACFVAALAISGVPPLNGFVSKWMIYQGIIESGKGSGGMWIVWLVTAMLGSALTLASFAKLLHAVYLCKRSPELEGKDIREVSPLMWIPMGLLALTCIVFGIAAYRLPLKHLIAPAVGVDVREMLVGTWWAGPATVMLVVAFAAGLLIYVLCKVHAGGRRECRTYIGGELMDDTYISGAPSGPADVEVTGVDFYRTIQDLWPFRPIYKAAEKKLFDIYDVGKGFLFYLIELLRKAHTGLLPMYLTWVVAGLLILLGLLLGNL